MPNCPEKPARQKFAAERVCRRRIFKTKPNSLVRRRWPHPDPASNRTATPSSKFQSQTQFPARPTQAGEAQNLKPNPIPPHHCPVKSTVFVAPGAIDDRSRPFRPSAKTQSQHLKKNSPAPEVPRFECNGPHPPPRSLQTDRKAAPAHRILDRGNKTAQATAALAVSSQLANSRRLAYNK